MSDYIRVYNLTIKDSLPTGNTNKVIKGTELDVELNAAAAAIASKADTNNPTFTGVPSAPTAAEATNTTQLATTAFVFNERSNTSTLTNKTINLSNNTLVATSAQLAAAVTDETGSGSLVFGTSPTISSANLTGTPVAATASYGTSTTQLATTAFVQAALQAMYPVGSVYINATVATNPSTLLGFGTWVTVGDGRVLVNQDTADTSFDVLGETGGSKDAIVIAHTHTFSTTSDAGGSHSHSISDPGHTHYYEAVHAGPVGGGIGFDYDPDGTWSGWNTGSSGTGISINTVAAHTHTLSGTTASTGSSGTNANLQPYVVVKMWKRTA